jgi:hypothetical protein
MYTIPDVYMTGPYSDFRQPGIHNVRISSVFQECQMVWTFIVVITQWNLFMLHVILFILPLSGVPWQRFIRPYQQWLPVVKIVYTFSCKHLSLGLTY